MLQLKGHECVCCESFENAAANAFMPLKLKHTHKILLQRDIVFDDEQTRHQSPFFASNE